MLPLEDYERKSFKAKAIQITEDNIHQVATFVDDMVRINRPRFGERHHIEVKTGGVNDRDQKTPAFVGDWITVTGRNLTDFRVWKSRKFWAAFSKPTNEMQNRRAEIRSILVGLTNAVESGHAIYGNEESFENTLDETIDLIMKQIS